MMSKKRLGVLAVSILLVAAAAVPVLASDYTVGQLVQRLAKEMNLQATDARMAADSLSKAGVRIPAELDYAKALTEADVAAIAQAAGLKVTTSKPDSPFSSSQVDRFFMTYAGELGWGGDGTVSTDGNAAGGPAFDPYSKGKGGSKGKKKGHRSPTDPE